MINVCNKIDLIDNKKWVMNINNELEYKISDKLIGDNTDNNDNKLILNNNINNNINESIYDKMET